MTAVAVPGSDRRATWLELFFDLVFAGALSQLGRLLATDYVPATLAHLLPSLALLWWAWAAQALCASRFGGERGATTASVVVQMFLVALMGANASLDPMSRDAAGFTAAYGALRAMQALQFLTGDAPGTRPLRRGLALGAGMTAAAWIAAALVPPAWRLALAAGALACEIATPRLASRHSHLALPDGAHLPERFGLFTLLVLGEGVTGVMAGIAQQAAWTPAAFVTAWLGLGTVFVLWWIYFRVLRAAAPRRLERHGPPRLRAWIATHLLLSVGLVVLAVGVRRTVTSGGLGPVTHADILLTFAGLAAVTWALQLLCWTASEAPGGRVGVATLGVLPLAGAALTRVLLPPSTVALLAAVFTTALVAALVFARRRS